MKILASQYLLPDQPLPTLSTKIEDPMALAYRIAWEGVGHVQSNPLVGAVLMDGNSLCGYGAHLIFGGPHAERNCLDPILEKHGKEFLRGKTLYSTLEPCAHQGKRPSCAQFIAKLPLKEVIYGQIDPNPMVSGKGAAIIKNAGIPCHHVASAEVPLERLTERFAANLAKRSFIGMKVACGLDGTSGLENSSRFWITGSRSKVYAHWLRQVYDALVVGAQTVILDDPSLDAREGLIKRQTPRKVVLDFSGKAAAHVQKKPSAIMANPASVIFVHREPSDVSRWLETQGAQVIFGNPEDLPRICQELYDLGLCSLLVEGGPQTWGLFLTHGLGDRLHLLQSPSLFGFPNKRHWDDGLGDIGPVQMTEGSLTTLDKDILVEGILSHPIQK